jgi:hypothetical protein
VTGSKLYRIYTDVFYLDVVLLVDMLYAATCIVIVPTVLNKLLDECVLQNIPTAINFTRKAHTRCTLSKINQYVLTNLRNNSIIYTTQTT